MFANCCWCYVHTDLCNLVNWNRNISLLATLQNWNVRSIHQLSCCTRRLSASHFMNCHSTVLLCNPWISLVLTLCIKCLLTSVATLPLARNGRSCSTVFLRHSLKCGWLLGQMLKYADAAKTASHLVLLNAPLTVKRFYLMMLWVLGSEGWEVCEAYT
jgi:hypothetical protein